MVTLEGVGAIAIVSVIYSFYNFVRICLLESKIYYYEKKIETLTTQTNAKNNALNVR